MRIFAKPEKIAAPIKDDFEPCSVIKKGDEFLEDERTMKTLITMFDIYIKKNNKFVYKILK